MNFSWLSFPCNINKQRSEFQINFKCASLTFGQLETERRTWKTKQTAKMVESLPVVQFVFYIWWMFFIFFMCLLFFFIFIILIIMVATLDLHFPTLIFLSMWWQKRLLIMLTSPMPHVPFTCVHSPPTLKYWYRIPDIAHRLRPDRNLRRIKS